MRPSHSRRARCRALPAFLLCLLLPLAVPPAKALAAAPLQANLDRAPFGDFLLLAVNFEGLEPAFDAKKLPRTAVSLSCGQGADAETLRNMFSLVLDIAGLRPQIRAGAFSVVPVRTKWRPDAPQTDILAQRLPAGHDPERAAQVLEALRSDAGAVRVSPAARAVALRDRPERIRRARAALNALAAAPAGAETEIIPLRRIRAAEAARLLELRCKNPHNPVTLALDRSNSVLLAGGAERLAAARRLLAQLDGGAGGTLELRKFSLRFARAERVAARLEPLFRSGDAMRARADAAQRAVFVLADPRTMARAADRVAAMDRPRLFVTAVVAEFPAGSAAEAAAAALRRAPDGENALFPAPPTANGNVRAFARAVVRPPSAAQRTAGGARDDPAARLAADPQARILARPMTAVQSGGEISVDATRGADAASGERFRLTLVPRLAAPGERIDLRVSLTDADDPGAPYEIETRLAPGAELLLVSGAAGEKSAPRLVVVLAVRPAETETLPAESSPARPETVTPPDARRNM